MRFLGFVILLHVSSGLAKTCPFLGPVFPAPKSLSTSQSFQSTLSSIRTNIESAITAGNSSHGPLDPASSYSIQIFSSRDEKPLFDYHRRGSDVVGNRPIDGDSIYRIASTTKLITVYLLLLQSGDGIFNDKVAKYLPELAGKQNWDEITVGALAGYIGGIVSELYGTDTLAQGSIGDFLPDAFPPLPPKDVSPCMYNQTGCTREVFLEALAGRRQAYLPNTTPGYSNAAFATLGLVLESVTGLSYGEVLRNSLSVPLHLTGTTDSTPSNSSRGVIVGSESASQWNMVLDGAGIGMGALFSTPNDLSAIGRAMLSSSLLPSNTTRAWLQPTAFTSSLIGAVGRPWEIFRAVIGPAENNRVVDLYTKAGNFGGFGSIFVLVPDYDIGFVVLHAGRRGRVPFEVSGLIVDELLPALEETARVEADAAFAGTYTAPNGLNSTFVLSSTAGIPGLTVDQWISNGTDIVAQIFGSPERIQLYPTNIKSADGRQYSWRASSISLEDTGPFSACPSWVALDRPTYGVYGLDEVVFHLNEDGKAIRVELKAQSIVLDKA
ncbi:beta-lactamase/transpeptidase-like protein [Pyrenochaeta sp. MPI-SDFR-AT-0127]|nr:beta-lactamase/transpeptidase-like protein [Pyrenochaeta sp. MPI-SDFR-AT-0127]